MPRSAGETVVSKVSGKGSVGGSSSFGEGEGGKTFVKVDAKTICEQRLSRGARRCRFKEATERRMKWAEEGRMRDSEDLGSLGAQSESVQSADGHSARLEPASHESCTLPENLPLGLVSG